MRMGCSVSMAGRWTTCRPRAVRRSKRWQRTSSATSSSCATSRRLGSDAYNAALSLTRADTVHKLLAQQGIDSKAIRAAGMGERQPVVQCPGTVKTAALVSCLQPNRRVEIEVAGEQ